MIFKFFKQDKTQPAESPSEEQALEALGPGAGVSEQPAVAELPVAAAGRLEAVDLRRVADASAWGGAGSDVLEPLSWLSAQDGALDDLGIVLSGLQVQGGYVLMPAGSALGPVLVKRLRELALDRSVPADWVYVSDLTGERRLKALPLPPGRGKVFAAGLASALDEIRATVPAALAGEDYALRRQTIAEEVRLAVEDRVDELRARAKAQNVALLRTPAGYTLAPMHESKVVRLELFAQLPGPMQREVEVRIGALERELEAILEQNAGAERVRRRRLMELEAEAARPHVAAALSELRAALTEADEALAHLSALEEDIVASAGLLADGEGAGKSAGKLLQRYGAELAVAHPHQDGSAPVVVAAPPTSNRLTGVASGGAFVPGLLHAAYGGFLLIDGRDLAADAGGLKALLAALRSRQVVPCAVGSEANRAALDPIPLAITVLVAGDRGTLARLVEADGETATLLPVVADLSQPVPRTRETEAETARMIATQVREAGLPAIDGEGLARLVEECARLAGHRDLLLVGSDAVLEAAAEAGMRARRAGREVVTREDVAAAVAARSARMRAAEPPCAWNGAKSAVGQVTAVATGFGAMSQPRIGSLSAQVERGGALQLAFGNTLLDAGRVARLCDFINQRFGDDLLAPAAASPRQNRVADADPGVGSAAAACALLSSLARVPLPQRLMVVGDMDPAGGLVAVAGMNEAIEAVHAVASRDGETGSAGVIVPRAAAGSLMLGEPAVSAVEAGWLTIAAVEHIDEAMELLSGLAAGARDGEGAFPAGSINGRVAARLAGWAAGGSRPAHGATRTAAGGEQA